MKNKIQLHMFYSFNLYYISSYFSNNLVKRKNILYQSDTYNNPNFNNILIIN